MLAQNKVSAIELMDNSSEEKDIVSVHSSVDFNLLQSLTEQAPNTAEKAAIHSSRGAPDGIILRQNQIRSLQYEQEPNNTNAEIERAEN